MKFSFYFLVLLLCFSCVEKKTSCTECDEEKEALVMYEPSELATLMLEMYDANQNWKEEILKGNIPSSFPEKFKSMQGAESVNESTDGEFYNSMTDAYLKSIDDLTSATSENAKEKYNNMVNVCIQCHQQICPGPIMKINKLIIE